MTTAPRHRNRQRPSRWRAGLRRAVFGPWRRVRASRLYLEVTHRCNLACPSCYTDAGAERPDALTLAEQKAVVHQARQMGARVVSLSGSGEPLLYRPLLELIDAAEACGMTAVVFTNGTACTPEMARALLRRKVVVYFQLPALTAEVVDAMTGTPNAHQWVPYTWQATGGPVTRPIPRGLKNLLDRRGEAAMADPVRLEALITRINYDALADVAAFSRALGLPLHLEVPVYTGRALANRDRLALGPEQYRRLHERLTGILGPAVLEDHRLHRCPVERNPVVRTNGDVALCSSRGEAVGNVRDRPLVELFAAARKLKRRQDRQVGRRCRAGTYFHTCRARRYYEWLHGLPGHY